MKLILDTNHYYRQRSNRCYANPYCNCQLLHCHISWIDWKIQGYLDPFHRTNSLNANRKPTFAIHSFPVPFHNQCTLLFISSHSQINRFLETHLNDHRCFVISNAFPFLSWTASSLASQHIVTYNDGLGKKRLYSLPTKCTQKFVTWSEIHKRRRLHPPERQL